MSNVWVVVLCARERKQQNRSGEFGFRISADSTISIEVLAGDTKVCRSEK